MGRRHGQRRSAPATGSTSTGLAGPDHRVATHHLRARLRHELLRRRRRSRRSANRSAKATLTATTEACPIDTQAPTAPTNLAVSGATANSLTLSWIRGDRRHRGHRLHPLPRPSQAGTTSGSTSYTYGGLACGSSYTLGVEAFDAVGNTSTRSTVVASTASCGPTSTTFVDAADAYVSSSTNKNNGTATTLRVKQSIRRRDRLPEVSTSAASPARPERDPPRHALRPRLGLRRLHHHLQLDRNRPHLPKRARPHHQARQLPLRQPHRLDQPRRHPGGHRQRHLQLRPRRHLLAGNLARRPRIRRQRTPTDHHQHRRPPPADTQPPTAPTNLTVTNTTTTSLTLTWTAATDNTAVTGYNLYRSTTAGFTPSAGNRIAQPTATGYTDTAPGGRHLLLPRHRP